MKEPRLSMVAVGSQESQRDIAVFRRDGAAPELLWLGGFKSDMSGTKAVTLDQWAGRNGLGSTRFDYSGHGQSSGAFRDGTISLWLEEALFVIRNCTSGPLILVGSSMGGWIALQAVKALQEAGESNRIGGIVLIAPAIDMTEELIWKRMDDGTREQMMSAGSISQPSEYSDEPYVLTWDLVKDGRKHLIGDEPIRIGCPVHILQGMRDEDVPWTHATGLMERLAHDDAVLTLVGDGDHRLSRPEDLERLVRSVEGMVKQLSGRPQISN